MTGRLMWTSCPSSTCAWFGVGRQIVLPWADAEDIYWQGTYHCGSCQAELTLRASS